MSDCNASSFARKLRLEPVRIVHEALHVSDQQDVEVLPYTLVKGEKAVHTQTVVVRILRRESLGLFSSQMIGSFTLKNFMFIWSALGIISY